MARPAVSYDVIVVGAGIEGSATAYSLAKHGLKVLLLEQFPVGHSRGSSSGYSRVTRYAYDDEFYIRMMKEVFPMWADIERLGGEKLYTQCGVLRLHRKNCPIMQRKLTSLRNQEVPHEVLEEHQVKELYPQVTPGEGIQALVDPSAGILRADRCLAVLQMLFKREGGVIRDLEKVTSVIPGENVTVMTSKGVYTSRQVVIAAGPWAKKFASDLGLELPMNLMRATVMFWRVLPEHEGLHSIGKLPIVVDFRSGKKHFVYAFPEFEYPGQVKVSPHGGPLVDPDLRDRASGQWVQDKVTNAVRDLFPCLDGQAPVIKETCIYASTPDYHPYIGRHPGHSNIVFVTGFSGHGFKLAPMVGQLVTELVTGQSPSYDMSRFKLDRFATKSQL